MLLDQHCFAAPTSAAGGGNISRRALAPGWRWVACHVNDNRPRSEPDASACRLMLSDGTTSLAQKSGLTK